MVLLAFKLDMFSRLTYSVNVQAHLLCTFIVWLHVCRADATVQGVCLTVEMDACDAPFFRLGHHTQPVPQLDTSLNKKGLAGEL